MSTEPKWLTKKDVLALHDQVLAAHGGESGILNEPVLDAAIARAQNAYHYEQKDVVDLAAVYADALTNGHAFVDGNKRTALTSMATFLEDNGVHYQGDQVQEVLRFEGLADGSVSRDSFSDWLRTSCSLEQTREQKAEAQQSELAQDPTEQQGVYRRR